MPVAMSVLASGRMLSTLTRGLGGVAWPMYCFLLCTLQSGSDEMSSEVLEW